MKKTVEEIKEKIKEYIKVSEARIIEVWCIRNVVLYFEGKKISNWISTRIKKELKLEKVFIQKDGVLIHLYVGKSINGKWVYDRYLLGYSNRDTHVVRDKIMENFRPDLDVLQEEVNKLNNLSETDIEEITHRYNSFVEHLDNFNDIYLGLPSLLKTEFKIKTLPFVIFK